MRLYYPKPISVTTDIASPLHVALPPLAPLLPLAPLTSLAPLTPLAPLQRHTLFRRYLLHMRCCSPRLQPDDLNVCMPHTRIVRQLSQCVEALLPFFFELLLEYREGAVLFLVLLHHLIETLLLDAQPFLCDASSPLHRAKLHRQASSAMFVAFPLPKS